MVERDDVAMRVLHDDGTTFRQVILRMSPTVLPGQALMVATWSRTQPDGTLDEGMLRIDGGGA